MLKNKMKIGENLENVLNKALDISNNISELQGKFMESKLYNILDSAVNIGIKVALPDIIEDEVIDVKDTILENGLVDGIKQAVDNIRDFGKSALGLITGNFENINQLQIATKNGGLIDTISKFFDIALEKSSNLGLLSSSTKKALKTEKNSILKDIKTEVSKDIDNQIKYIDKINEYNTKWQMCFENKDLKGMKSANKNIQKYLKSTLPLEKVLRTARKIETLQNLIESKGSFDLSDEEKELAETLSY